MAAPQESETQELVKDLRNRRIRRRRLRLLLAGVGAAAVLAGLITAVVLAMPGSGDQTGGSTPSSSEPAGWSLAGGSATSTSMTTGGTSGLAPTASPPVSEATVSPGETTTSVPSSTSTTGRLTGKVVVIDPGHQAKANYDLEPIGPGSSTKKAKVSSGTSGVATGTPESELVLAIGLKLRDALRALGITVIMTRVTQDVDISNIQRARMANVVGADLFVRLHANGAADRSVSGLFTLYPASREGWTDDIAADSKEAAELAQRYLIAETGAEDDGVHPRSDLTGFNWSDVPAILVELGYMTNPAEDRLLATAAYQDKIVQGFVRAVEEFLRTR
jgi:N-acetylmuramoyl-L-alanine amidase